MAGRPPPIRTATTIAAPPAEVWRRLADIDDHVTWMADAAAIRFTGDRRRGVGTVFECETRLGPLRTTDVMEITEWRDDTAMGVRHQGLFTGEGRFELVPDGAGGTVLSWEEALVFPWWLGGPLGAWVARPVLRAVWRGNLRRFSALVAQADPSA